VAVSGEVDIIEYEDPAVKNLLTKTAEELRAKYNKQRKINEKLLKKKTPIQKSFSVVFDIMVIILFVFGGVVCFSTLNTTINGYMPNFAGYSNLVIASGSMVDSGYNVGDIVITHSVDTDTLNVEDKIAFYVYYRSSMQFDVSKATNVSDEISKTKYSLKLGQLFGFQTEEVQQATKAGSKLVFHHIKEIYEDENGERWFKTYGSSNGGKLDDWWISEKYVVGIEDQGVVGKSVIGLVTLASKPYGFAILGTPVLVLLGVLVMVFAKNIQIAKLELDCVEEKRRITDEICVKNNVGFQMSNKTKLKILAQAIDENKEQYIKLLWKKGQIPNSVEKYYMRKKLLLIINKELLNLNRECEDMFKQGENPKVIAEHYLSEKQKIENRNVVIRERFKHIDKQKAKAQISLDEKNKKN